MRPALWVCLTLPLKCWEFLPQFLKKLAAESEKDLTWRGPCPNAIVRCFFLLWIFQRWAW
jgi:hypothetical protein